MEIFFKKLLTKKIIKSDFNFRISNLKVEIIKKLSPFFDSSVKFKDATYFNLTNKFLMNEIEKIFKNLPKQNKKILLEYSQPNICKCFHVGHLRNLLIGDFLRRIYEFQGNKVISINYPGDMGTHVAISIWMIFKDFFLSDNIKNLENELLNYVTKSKLSKINFLNNIYTKGCTQKKDNIKEIKEILTHLEKNDDKKIMRVFEIIRKWSLNNFNEIYEYFGCKFDEYIFESDVKILQLDDLYKQYKNVNSPLIKSKGTIGINSKELGYFMFITSNNNSLYSAKDINLLKYKNNRWPDIDENLYLVDKGQVNHFKNIFMTLKKLNYKGIEKCRHIPHGLVNFNSGNGKQKMSSRNGYFVSFEELKIKLINSLKKKHPNFKDQKVKSFVIGILRFEFLQINIIKDVVFDLKNFENLNYIKGYKVLKIFYEIQIPCNDYKNSEIGKNDRKIMSFILIFKDILRSNSHSKLCDFLVKLSSLIKSNTNNEIKYYFIKLMKISLKTLLGIPIYYQKKK